MWRVFLEPAALFFSPFVAYALFMAFVRAEGQGEKWSKKHVSALTLAGLALAAAGVLLLGVRAERHQGAYVPAHIENGQLVPGHMD